MAHRTSQQVQHGHPVPLTEAARALAQSHQPHGQPLIEEITPTPRARPGRKPHPLSTAVRPSEYPPEQATLALNRPTAMTQVTTPDGRLRTFQENPRHIALPTGPIELCPDRNHWERQPVESDKQWLMFRAYRDIDASERSLAAGWRQWLSSTGKCTPDQLRNQQPSGWYSNLCAMMRWRERSSAFDRYIDQQAQEALVASRVTARVKAAGLGQQILLKTAEAVSVLQTVLHDVRIGPDGTREVVIRSALSPSDIVRLAKVGKDLQWAGLGLDEQGGRQVSIGITVNPQQAWSDAEIVDRADEILVARRELIDA